MEKEVVNLPVCQIRHRMCMRQKIKKKDQCGKILEYVKEAAYLRNFTQTGDFAGIMITLHDIYKDDIVNPYTGGSSIYVMNRTRTYMKIKICL